ncbi:hypothetical protein JXA32_08895 [Candidatus Sumerlaeota bacterium]|nr:hypothetical protein [Candidatus Sumerlaeota bacterium]
MSDNSFMPPFSSTILKVEKLRQLLQEIHQSASDVRVQVKRDSLRDTTQQDASEAPLDRIPDLLERRGAYGAKITYRYQEQEWRDDLKVVPGGVRLIRIKVE